MGFWNTLTKKAKQKIFQGFYSRQVMIPPNLNTQDYLKSYGEIGWLFACVSRISQNVASTEWRAVNKDTKEQVEQSMALDVLLNPNPHYSLYDTLELTNMYMDLVGKAFWYIAKDMLGRPKEIWVVNPMYMQIIPDYQNHIRGYAYQDGSNRVPLEPDEVIFFKNPDPNNPYSGVSAGMASANALESDKYAAQWNRNFFYNNAEPQGVLTVPAGLDDNEYDRLKAEWNDRYGGVGNAKKTAILEGGATYQSIQISQKDMDFYQLRASNRDEILATYGVPKSILGLTEGVNRANAETSEYTFAKHTINPRLRRIKDKINSNFVVLFGEEGIELEYKDIIPENNDFIKSVLDSQTDKSITKNEARKVLSRILNIELEPIEGGDVIYQQTSLQPMGTLPPGNMPVPTESGQTALLAHPHPAVLDLQEQHRQEDQAREDAKVEQARQDAQAAQAAAEQQNGQKALKKKFNSEVRLKVATQITKNNSNRHVEFLKTAKPLEKEFKDSMAKYFSDMKKDVIKNLNDGNLDPVNVQKWNKVLQDNLVGLYTKCFKVGGEKVVNEFKSIETAINKDLNVVFDYKDPKVVEMIKAKVNKSKIINEDTKNAIKNIIENQYNSEDGFTIGDIADKINDENFYPFSDSRATTVAQTEVLTSLNQATNLSYQQNADLIDGKYWLSNNDDLVRESHREAAETYDKENNIPVTDNFVVGGYECECPGDDSLPAEEVINCRCCMAPYVQV